MGITVGIFGATCSSLNNHTTHQLLDSIGTYGSLSIVPYLRHLWRGSSAVGTFGETTF